MGQSALYTVAIGTEATFGTKSATTNFPDVAVADLTLVAIAAERAFSDTFGGAEQSVLGFELTTDGQGASLPPVPISEVNTTGGALFGAADGELMQRELVGDITLRVPVSGIGDGVDYATYPAHPLYKLLRTCMGEHTPAQATDTVAALAANAYTFQPTLGVGQYTVGEMLQVTQANQSYFVMVTDVDAAPLITFTPELPAALAMGDTIRFCYTLYPSLGSSLPTVCIRADTEPDSGSAGWRRYMFGCRVRSVVFDVGDDKAVVATFTIRVGGNRVFDTKIPVQTVYTAPVKGYNVSELQGCHQRGDTAVSTGTVPGHFAASDWDTRALSLAYNFGLSEDSGCSALQESGVTIASAVVAWSVTDDGSVDLSRELVDQNERNYVCNFGPAPYTGAWGNGMGCILPAGHLVQIPTPDEDENQRITQAYELRNGNWALDDGATAPAGTSFRLGFPLPL